MEWNSPNWIWSVIGNRLSAKFNRYAIPEFTGLLNAPAETALSSMLLTLGIQHSLKATEELHLYTEEGLGSYCWAEIFIYLTELWYVDLFLFVFA